MPAGEDVRRDSLWTQIYWGTPKGEAGPLKPTVRLICGETEKHRFWHGINLGEHYFDNEDDANVYADRVDAWLDDAVSDDYFFCDGYVKRFCDRPIRRKTQLQMYTVVFDRKHIPKDQWLNEKDFTSVFKDDKVLQFVYAYIRDHQWMWTKEYGLDK